MLPFGMMGVGGGGSSNLLKDGLIVYRKLIRGGYYVIDYSSDGGATWDLAIVSLEPDEDVIIINIDHGVSGYRQTVRGGVYVIDHDLGGGYLGTENIDWENIYSLKPV
jgi:hypothetical protein